jgi:hypothetical protein
VPTLRCVVRVPRGKPVGFCDESAEVGIPFWCLSQKGEVESIAREGGGRPVGFARQSAGMDREFGTSNGPNPHGSCTLCELHAPIKPVVIGEGESWISQLGSPAGQIFWVRCAVQK